MYAVEAIYDGISFKPKQPIFVKGQYEVIITFTKPVSQTVEKNSRFLVEPDTSNIPMLGKWNGEIEVPDDFNEPLDELKEYMY